MVVFRISWYYPGWHGFARDHSDCPGGIRRSSRHRWEPFQIPLNPLIGFRSAGRRCRFFSLHNHFGRGSRLGYATHYSYCWPWQTPVYTGYVHLMTLFEDILKILRCQKARGILLSEVVGRFPAN